MSPKRKGVRDPDLRPEYDFSEAVRGKYYERYRQGTNVVLLDPDVAAVFRDGAAVNDALRSLVAVADAKVAAGRRGGKSTRSNTYQPSPRQAPRSSPSGRRVKKTRDRKK